MADVFLSYSRADRETVERLAASLKAAGHTVWWDARIKSGAEFSADIEREIADAKVVLVCWSANANRSRWVKDEANAGAEAGKLMAITLDGALPPMGFRQFHCTDFANWTGAEDSAEMAHLKAVIDERLTGNVADRDDGAAVAPLTPSRSGNRALLASLAVGVLAVGALAIFLMRGAGDTETGDGGGAVAAADAGDEADAPTPYESIAVLAFADLSADGDQEYFSDGIADELLNMLARETTLRVAARTSSFSFKNSNEDIAVIARALNVDAVLDGSVRKVGDRVRITAQLVDAATGYSLWTNTFDRDLTDIFEIQDEVARAIVAALPGEIMHNVAASAATTDPETFDLYLRAQYQLERRGDGIALSIALLEEAVSRDPNFAPAQAQLALAKMFYRRIGGSPARIEDVVASARPHIDRALELDPDLAEGYVAQAYALRSLGRHDEAIDAFQRAIDINPSVSNARHLMYISMQRVGRIRDSFKMIDDAIRLDPLSPSVAVNHVYSLLIRGRTDEAIVEARRLVDLHPDYRHGAKALGDALMEAGKLAEAADFLTKTAAATNNPQHQMARAIALGNMKILEGALPERAPPNAQAFSQILQGRPDAAAAILEAAQQANPDQFGQDSWNGQLLFWAGREDAAYEFFEDYMQRTVSASRVATRDRCDDALMIAALRQRKGDPAGADAMLAECRQTLDALKAQDVQLLLTYLPDHRAQLLILEGRLDEGLAELERLADTGRFFSWWIFLNPLYEPVKGDPRFENVVERVDDFVAQQRERYLAMAAESGDSR